MDFKSLLNSAALESEITLTAAQLEKFEKYYTMLIEWNKVMNLTSLTEPEDVINKHFVDCLLLFKYADIPIGAKVIDVGTGAGFPGVVMKIYRKDLELTLLDSLNKRLAFLTELGKNIGFSAEIIHSRAEEAGKHPNLRGKYDVAVSRAVAQLNVLSEYCVPFLKNGGYFYALKGPHLPEEAEDARHAIQLLGGKMVSVSNYGLPNGDRRAIIGVKKIKSTPPAYPRPSAKIKSKPL